MLKMENAILGKIRFKILENKKLLAKEIKCKPLIGAVGGSISLNLANESSDVDVYLITAQQDGENILHSVYLEGEKVDFMCVTLEDLKKECAEYAKQEHKYPTRFYRNQIEKDLIVQKKDVERPNFKREMVMRIFIADEIIEFEEGIAQQIYEELKNGLSLIDIWDYHFNRAYGNYYEKIKDYDKVSLRKYLYIVSQISICHMLLKSNKIVMDYRKMFESPYCIYNDNEIIEICVKLWEQNSKVCVNKKEDCIVPNFRLNQWIENNLEELLQGMKDKELFLRNQFLPYDINKVKSFV